MMNCAWLLSGEAVDAAETGEAGDASLKHSSSIWVAGWFQARFQMRPDDDDTPSSSCRASFFGEACEVLLGRVIFLAVTSWRDGGRVRDPVEAAFHGRSGHNYYYYCDATAFGKLPKLGRGPGPHPSKESQPGKSP